MSNENDSLATLEVQRVILHAEAFEDNDSVPKNYVLSQVDVEMNRAMTAEGSLETKIETESARAVSKEGELESSILAENTRAVARENAIESALQEESARALAAEGSLETKIETESARAQAREGQLETQIETESKRAQDAEATKANLSGADFSGAVKMFEYLHFGENWRVKASVDGARIVFQHKKADGSWKNAVPFICSV